jgi:hypothetical protein
MGFIWRGHIDISREKKPSSVEDKSCADRAREEGPSANSSGTLVKGSS